MKVLRLNRLNAVSAAAWMRRTIIHYYNKTILQFNSPQTSLEERDRTTTLALFS